MAICPCNSIRDQNTAFIDYKKYLSFSYYKLFVF
jgi:hypothetical protein